MPSTWKPLYLSRKHNQGPPLLVKYQVGPSDYKVWLTDLSYIWTESLDRRQLLRRALSNETSIDPSLDSAQMLLFLKSITDALRQLPGTSVSLNQSNEIKRLNLNTSTPLPHPLQPLEWSIILMLAPQSMFALEFLSPLLARQLTARAQKASLIQQLKEKDNVISKLMDKMQGDGVDLRKMFPGAVPSKSSTGSHVRGAVAKSFKGFQEFDENQWQSQVATENPYSGDIGPFLPLIFDEEGQDAGEGLQIAAYDEWWKEGSRTDSRREGATPATLNTDAKEETMVEDDFQRQSTPTKLSIHTARHARLKLEAEPDFSGDIRKSEPEESGSTTDESYDDLQPADSKSLESRTDNAFASDSANQADRIQSKPMALSDDGLTTSASDPDESLTKSHLALKPKKLGKIGGKGRGNSSEALPISTPERRIGKIGGKGKPGKLSRIESGTGQSGSPALDKQEDAVNPNSDEKDPITAPKPMESERKARTSLKRPEPSPPRETSQERANKKREQLKRELENKSHVTVKKKRRF